MIDPDSRCREGEIDQQIFNELLDTKSHSMSTMVDDQLVDHRLIG